MKLRKALDKAKFEKVNNARHIVPRLNKKETSSRQAPVYAESRKHPLDPKITAKNRGVCLQPNPKEIERYKILRTRINQKSSERPVKTVMVTSPNPGEGKTVTCINMAFTFAKELNHTVLMVDCDLKAQDIHRYLGIDSKHSLIDYLVDDMPLQDLIIWPEVEKLTLISGSRSVENAPELLSSPMMATLIKEMGRRYDDRYVLFDAPPLLERAEAISMAPLVDAVLMVVESGVTSKKDVLTALELLPREKFLGFVLNKQD